MTEATELRRLALRIESQAIAAVAENVRPEGDPDLDHTDAERASHLFIVVAGLREAAKHGDDFTLTPNQPGKGVSYEV